MSDGENGDVSGFDKRRLRPLLPLASVLCLSMAIWFAWAAWQHWLGEQRHARLLQARDAAVQGVQLVLKNEATRLHQRSRSAPVRAALASGDLEAAAAVLGADWKTARQVTILPVAMERSYAELTRTGHGLVAAAEAALASGEAASRVGKDAQGVWLFVAAPVDADDAAAADPAGARQEYVAVARFPVERLTSAVLGIEPGDAGYIALRQGSATLHGHGNKSLENGAEALAAKVPGSGLRVAAGMPDKAAGPFGLGVLPAMIGVLTWLGLAFSFQALWRRKPAAGATVTGEAAPTLAQMLAREPLPEPYARTPTEQENVNPSASDTPEAGADIQIDPGIFRAYDIRGVVGRTLSAEVAAAIGRAVGTSMHEQGLDDIVVGRDGRLSGPELTHGLIEGLRAAGRNVIDIGMAPTPLVYFGSHFLRTGCCVAVTGSHNPPDYNGFKIVVGGQTLSGAAITDLHARIVGGRLHEAAQVGSLTERRIDRDYIDRIAEDVQMQRPLKVVVDAGNGVAGELGPQVLEAIGAEVTPLYCQIDGTFPNHHPDPSEPHNLEDLIQTVQRLGADLGIAFDGDGDRLGVVTPDGENIFPDRLLMLFAADVLERNPGAQIIYDVKSTGRLQGHVLRHGGSPLMWKTGHSLIKAKMRETGAELAGEMSGHFFFSERWFGFDDGIYSAARLLEILAAHDDPPGQILAALPGGVSTPEIKLDAPDGDPHAFVEGFRAQARFDGGSVTTIDGMRVDWEDGWGLIRASNTTPALVLRFDADDDTALRRIQAAFRAQLLAYRPDLSITFGGDG